MRMLWACLLIACLASPLWAQNRTRRMQPAAGGRGALANFDRNAPKVGELLPDVAGLDADGKPLRLRSLRGHYSVLVFGCLT